VLKGRDEGWAWKKTRPRKNVFNVQMMKGKKPSTSHELPFHFFLISLTSKSMSCIGCQCDLKFSRCNE
jgi:hypothetical protein